MPGWLGSLVEKFDSEARRSASYSERHFKILGYLAVVIPLAYIVDRTVGDPDFDTLGVRLLAYAFAIPLIFHDQLRGKPREYFHRYFVTLVAYTLPFTFGLMLVMNAAQASPGKQIEMLWVLQYFVALFLFIQLTHSGLLASLLWIVSSAAAIAPLMWLEAPNWSELQRVVVYPISAYLTALVFGVLTNRNVDYVNREKLQAVSSVGDNIAHELRTPLASIGLLTQSARKTLDALMEIYEKAGESGIHTNNSRSSRIPKLPTVLEAIASEVVYANTVIDMLLLNTKAEVRPNIGASRFRVSEIIQESLDRFPFNNSDERRLVEVETIDDFPIVASRLLVIHTVFNLLKNAIYFVQKSNIRRVTVRSYISGKRNVLEVQDTGPGLTPEVRKHLFERFHKTGTNSQGAGIGLSFCKMVMIGIGGDIQYESKEGEYTTFRLLFPPVS